MCVSMCLFVGWLLSVSGASGTPPHGCFHHVLNSSGVILPGFGSCKPSDSCNKLPLHETYPLQINGWKMNFLWDGLFSGAILVSGSVLPIKFIKLWSSRVSSKDYHSSQFLGTVCTEPKQSSKFGGLQKSIPKWTSFFFGGAEFYLTGQMILLVDLILKIYSTTKDDMCFVTKNIANCLRSSNVEPLSTPNFSRSVKVLETVSPEVSRGGKGEVWPPMVLLIAEIRQMKTT